MITRLHCAYLHVSNCWTRGGLTPLIADNPLKKSNNGPDQTTVEFYRIHIHVAVHQYTCTSTHLQWNPAKPITITPKNLPVLTRWPDFKYTYMDSLHWNRKTAPTTNHFNILPCHQYCHFHTTSHGPQGVQSQHHSLHVPQVGNLSLIRRNMKLVQCGCQPGLCRYLQRF